MIILSKLKNKKINKILIKISIIMFFYILSNIYFNKNYKNIIQKLKNNIDNTNIYI